MQQILKKRKAKGFTLVELLIVIIIIGILAGALLLVAGAGTDKAEATKIVSNLRNAKAASIMCYADFNAWPTEIASISEYMESEFSSADYSIATEVIDSDDCFIGFDDDDKLQTDNGVAVKLENIATNGDVPLKDSAGAEFTAANGDDGVWLQLN